MEKLKELEQQREDLMGTLKQAQKNAVQFPQPEQKPEELAELAAVPETPEEELETLVTVADAVINSDAEIDPQVQRNLEEKILDNIVEVANEIDDVADELKTESVSNQAKENLEENIIEEMTNNSIEENALVDVADTIVDADIKLNPEQKQEKIDELNKIPESNKDELDTLVNVADAVVNSNVDLDPEIKGAVEEKILDHIVEVANEIDDDGAGKPVPFQPLVEVADSIINSDLKLDHQYRDVLEEKILGHIVEVANDIKEEVGKTNKTGLKYIQLEFPDSHFSRVISDDIPDEDIEKKEEKLDTLINVAETVVNSEDKFSPQIKEVLVDKTLDNIVEVANEIDEEAKINDQEPVPFQPLVEVADAIVNSDVKLDSQIKESLEEKLLDNIIEVAEVTNEIKANENNEISVAKEESISQDIQNEIHTSSDLDKKEQELDSLINVADAVVNADVEMNTKIKEALVEKTLDHIVEVANEIDEDAGKKLNSDSIPYQPLVEAADTIVNDVPLGNEIKSELEDKILDNIAETKNVDFEDNTINGANKEVELDSLVNVADAVVNSDVEIIPEIKEALVEKTIDHIVEVGNEIEVNNEIDSSLDDGNEDDPTSLGDVADAIVNVANAVVNSDVKLDSKVKGDLEEKILHNLVEVVNEIKTKDQLDYSDDENSFTNDDILNEEES